MPTKLLTFALLALTLSSCHASKNSPRRSTPVANASKPNYQALGKRIWQNECAGTVRGLVSWNVGEDFPSLGIGHFIWYPAGVQAPFAESMPNFVRFARQRGIKVPRYFDGPAPWAHKSIYEQSGQALANQMRQWLAANLDIQARFLVARAGAALGKMQAASRKAPIVRQRFIELSRSTQGLYCLVDYVNFKGEGIKASERYAGQGWGLLQVLEEMQGATSTAEFSRAAAAVLSRRVRNAPPARGEQRWLAGWLNRCKSYR